MEEEMKERCFNLINTISRYQGTDLRPQDVVDLLYQSIGEVLSIMEELVNTHSHECCRLRNDAGKFLYRENR